MRSAAVSVISAALLASSAAAYKDSSPLLIWSSSPNAQLEDAKEALTSGVIAAEEVYGSITSLGCDWDALAVVHVDDSVDRPMLIPIQLHQSRISNLRLPEASADLHIPYLIRPSRDMVDTAVDEWAKICGADVVSATGEIKGKSVVQLNVGSEHDVAALTSSLPASHLILLTGSRKLEARKERPFPSHSSSSTASATTSSKHHRPSHSSGSGKHKGHSGNDTDTIPTSGPLLDRVQILTTPIITALLISFLIFIPIIMFGVYALVGIQVPPRMMEIGKGLVVNKDRKDQ